jgi:hypothetical protein
MTLLMYVCVIITYTAIILILKRVDIAFWSGLISTCLHERHRFNRLTRK